MKKLALLTLLAALALAGDDYQQTVAYTGTAACSTILRPKAKYAVRCTTDCHVKVTVLAATSTATTSDVKLLADKLYDLPTTANQRYICAIQVSAGGNMFVYLNRGTSE
jgi:hypothetical protein